MNGLTGPTLDALLRSRLIRSYPFAVAPTSARNTFPAGYTITNDLPAVLFESNGAVAETNKIIELRVEKVDWDNMRPLFFAPGSTVDGDFVWQIDCQLWGSAQTPANVGSDAYHGIQYSSPLQNIPGQGGYANGFVQLRRRFDDPTRWVLFGSNSGLTTESVAFQVATEGGLEGGHRVSLIGDPYHHTVTAIVDGVVRAQLGFDGYPMGIAGTFRSGLVVFSGTQTGATKLYAGWSSMLIQDLATGTVGSGVV